MKTLLFLLFFSINVYAKTTKQETDEICKIMTDTHVSLFESYRSGVAKLTALENLKTLPLSLQQYFKKQADDIWAGVYKSYAKETYRQLVFTQCKQSFNVK